MILTKWSSCFWGGGEVSRGRWRQVREACQEDCTAEPRYGRDLPLAALKRWEGTLWHHRLGWALGPNADHGYSVTDCDRTGPVTGLLLFILDGILDASHRRSIPHSQRLDTASGALCRMFFFPLAHSQKPVLERGGQIFPDQSEWARMSTTGPNSPENSTASQFQTTGGWKGP